MDLDRNTRKPPQLARLRVEPKGTGDRVPRQLEGPALEPPARPRRRPPQAAAEGRRVAALAAPR